MTNEFPLSYELRIDWSEIDSFGHVNNLAIMRYVQSTRVYCLEHMGMMQHHSETGVGPILASTSCQFKKQLYYPGGVLIRARFDHIKNTSFHITYTVFNEARELVAEASDVLVMFDFDKNSKTPIPIVFRERLKALGASSMV
jgi:acyl-CoA thioester hydrolase